MSAVQAATPGPGTPLPVQGSAVEVKVEGRPVTGTTSSGNTLQLVTGSDPEVDARAMLESAETGSTGEVLAAAKSTVATEGKRRIHTALGTIATEHKMVSDLFEPDLIQGLKELILGVVGEKCATKFSGQSTASGSLKKMGVSIRSLAGQLASLIELDSDIRKVGRNELDTTLTTDIQSSPMSRVLKILEITIASIRSKPNEALDALTKMDSLLTRIAEITGGKLEYPAS